MIKKIKCYLGIHSPVLYTTFIYHTDNYKQEVRCEHCGKSFVVVDWVQEKIRAIKRYNDV